MSFVRPAYARNASVPKDSPSDYTTHFKAYQVVLIKGISSPWSHLYPSTLMATIRLFLLQHGSKSASGHKASHLLRGT